MKRHAILFIGLFMLIFCLLIMFVGPHLPFIDSSMKQELIRFNGGKLFTPPYRFSKENWFGSDENGRDLLSLVVMGAKSTLLLVFAATFLRYSLAIPLGLLGTRKKGIIHFIISGLNKFFTALPTLFFAILFLSMPNLMFAEHRIVWVALIIALIEVGRVASIIQNQSHVLTKELYIEATKTIGVHPFKIYFKHVLPALVPEVVVNFFLDAARVMLLIGQLGVFNLFISQTFVQTGFSGGKLQDTSHNWATLLAEARVHLWAHIWIFIFPAIAVALAIIMFLCLGEGFRKFFSRQGV